MEHDGQSSPPEQYLDLPIYKLTAELKVPDVYYFVTLLSYVIQCCSH
jgi:hypothetical protein